MAPPKEFKNNGEVNQYYDQMMAEITDEEHILETALNEVHDLMVDNVSYLDEEGEKKSSHLLQGLAHGDMDALKEMYNNLYGNGLKTIREVTRVETVPYFMMWYCRTNGINEEEIVTLGKNPQSPEALQVKEKIKALRQDFKELMSSNDSEKLSEFFLNVFAEFEKKKNMIQETTDLSSFKENWKYLGQFAGATGLQQSLETAQNERNEFQNKLIGKLNEKIAKKYGPEVHLNDLIATMSGIHTAKQSLSKNGMTSRERFQYEETSADDRNLFLHERRQRMCRIIRGFRAMTDLMQQNLAHGDEQFYSQAMGHAGAFNAMDFNGYNHEFADTDLDYDVRRNHSETRYAEMRLYGGDPTGYTLVNMDALREMRYFHDGEYLENGEPLTYVDTSPNAESWTALFNVDEMNQAYANMKVTATVERKGEQIPTTKFMADLEKRLREHHKLREQDIAAYKSEYNTAYTKELKDLEKQIYSKNLLFRPSSLKDPVFKAIMSQQIERFYATSVEDYVLGGSAMKKSAIKAYAETSKAVLEGTNPSRVHHGFHEQMMAELDKELQPVGVTIASSTEFKNMERAFQALKNPQLLENGNEELYREALKTLSKACATYIHAKEADGKKERTTDRGQIRFNLAKKMHDFAKNSIEGMESVQRVVDQKKAEEQFLTTNKVSYARLNAQGQMQRRIMELMSPEAPGSSEMIETRIYEKSYKPAPIPKPEGCPYNDYQMALMAVAALSEGTMFRETDRKNPLLTDRENGLNLMVHSTTDIFINLRPGAHSIVSHYDEARQIAHDNVKKYIQGDSKPLAQMLGNNIRASMTHLHTRTNMNEIALANTMLSQQIMNILREDPVLLSNSTLSKEEIQNFEKLEKHAKLYEDSLKAEEELKKDQKDHHLSTEERLQYKAETIAYALIDAENNAITDEYKAKDSYIRQTMELMPHISQLGVLKSQIKDAKIDLAEKPNDPDRKAQVVKLEKQLQQADYKVATKQFEMILAENEKEYASLLNDSVGKTYEEFKKAMTDRIKESPHFQMIAAEKHFTGDVSITDLSKEIYKEKLAQPTVVQQIENPPQVKEVEQKKEEPQIVLPPKTEEVNTQSSVKENILEEKTPEELFDQKFHQEKDLYGGPLEDSRYTEFAKFGKLNDINPYKMVSELAVDAMDRVHQACIQRKGYHGIEKDLKLMAANQILHVDRKSASFNNIPGVMGEDLMRQCKTKEDVLNVLQSANLGNLYADAVAPLFDKNASPQNKAHVLKEFVYGNKAEQIADNSRAVKLGNIVRVKDEKTRSFFYGNSVEEIKKTISNKHADKTKEMNQRLKQIKENSNTKTQSQNKEKGKELTKNENGSTISK